MSCEVRGGVRKGMRKEMRARGPLRTSAGVRTGSLCKGTPEQSPFGAPLLPETNVPLESRLLVLAALVSDITVSSRSSGLAQAVRAEKHGEGGTERGRVCVQPRCLPCCHVSLISLFL